MPIGPDEWERGEKGGVDLPELPYRLVSHKECKCCAHEDINVVDEEQDVQMAEVTATEGHSFRGVGRIEQPAAGLGKLNYDVFLRRLERVRPNAPIIIEHLEYDDISRAKAWLDQKLLENGV